MPNETPIVQVRPQGESQPIYVTQQQPKEPRPQWELMATLIGVILSVMVQTGLIVWWASGIDHRVATIEAEHVNYQTQSVEIAKLDTKLDDLIARIDHWSSGPNGPSMNR